MRDPSRNHIGWSSDGSTEWFERGGNVYRAPASNAIMPDGYRCGRYLGAKHERDARPVERETHGAYMNSLIAVGFTMYDDEGEKIDCWDE